MKRYLIMPLETAPLLLAGIFALLLAFAHLAGLYGIPVGVILTSWFFKYCFALLDAVIAGDKEPPVLSYEILDPLTRKRLLSRIAVMPLGVVLPLILPDCGIFTMFGVYLLLQLAALLVFSVIGGLVFEHRIELGIETRSLDERRAERTRRNLEQDRSAILDRAYGLVRLKRRADAWNEVQHWIQLHCAGDSGLSEYHTLFSATSAWDDPAIADRITSQYLDRLLATGQTGMAVDILADRLTRQPDFRPATPATTVRLVELARLAGRGTLSRQLEANGR